MKCTQPCPRDCSMRTFNYYFLQALRLSSEVPIDRFPTAAFSTSGRLTTRGFFNPRAIGCELTRSSSSGR